MLGLLHCNGLASHPGGSRNSPSHFIQQKPEISTDLHTQLTLFYLRFTEYIHNSIHTRKAWTNSLFYLVTHLATCMVMVRPIDLMSRVYRTYQLHSLQVCQENKITIECKNDCTIGNKYWINFWTPRFACKILKIVKTIRSGNRLTYFTQWKNIWVPLRD